MSEVHLDVVARRVSATPASYIARARHQTRAGLGALSDLSAVWTDVPDTVELGVVDLFLSHLRPETVPEDPPLQGHLGPEFAQQSLMGLTEMDRRLDDPEYLEQSAAILAAWPGIFKWVHYLLKQYLASRERNDLPKLHNVFRFLDFYAQSQRFIVPMVLTPGCVELVTECWMVEDASQFGAAKGDGILSRVATMTSRTLAILLNQSTARGKADINERVVEAAGGDAESVMQLLLRRTKRAIRSVRTPQEAFGLLWHFNLAGQLCRPVPPPLRRAFFDAGGVAVMTRAFVAISSVIRQHFEETTSTGMALLSSCIIFFSHYLEADDYLSILHAIKAGLLHGFLECAPAIWQMEQRIIDKVVAIVRDALPPYLVYSSVFEAILPFVEAVQSVAHFKQSLANPAIGAAFEPLLTFAERRRPERQFETGRNVESVRSCVNRECQRVDLTNSFKTCKACQKVYYCSPECQKIDWKAQHREWCKVSREEASVGHRTRSDQNSVQLFAQRMAIQNVAIFRDLVKRDFPGTPIEKVVLCIDFSTIPETYSVSTDGPEEDQQRILEERGRERGCPIMQCCMRNGNTMECIWLSAPMSNFWGTAGEQLIDDVV
ncbi:hypothetical protein FB45DRAFT_920164 [Roridomyces roridus]|uniref:MYND-type domain-containing protein n=1 Tax=Roridomyces roridus TaxID=1738132 RepID=A0AAD7BPM4_9AGAR|nr:hypothetical protein FB45DRAFT_920164 [Roridomyces roridus]